MYGRALVPVDGSEFARAALEHLPHLSPREVVLVTVVESVAQELARQTGIVANVPADVARKVEAAALAEHGRQLREAEQALRERGWEGAVTQVVRHGKPGPQIVALAAELSCDVIVMATHGRTGIRRALLGSVAEHVVAHVTGSAVLLVRPADGATPSTEAA
jgi:nucleotide-binding universal stress UspA family protein